jgi:hypothetical protein
VAHGAADHNIDNNPHNEQGLMDQQQGCKRAAIAYLLLTYGAHIHEARCSALVYLVTRNPFTPLLESK